MDREYHHNIEKLHEGEDYCLYSYKTSDEEGNESSNEVEITGVARYLIDALGNALLKESFQDFEK
jgi:hypothetical protein